MKKAVYPERMREGGSEARGGYIVDDSVHIVPHPYVPRRAKTRQTQKDVDHKRSIPYSVERKTETLERRKKKSNPPKNNKQRSTQNL